MPILKPSRSSGNGVGGSQRRVRLNAAMISAPLGDFRHTMHVGRGGDAFGDTSFLSNHGPAKDPESPKLTPSNNNNHHTPPMSDRNPEHELDSFNASVKTKATNNNGISKSGDMEKVSDGGFGRKEESKTGCKSRQMLSHHFLISLYWKSYTDASLIFKYN
uniref:CRIB domain-containing protein n=1 Tax=Erpetoichthys calabaricus TaxID=27687 RepID=A0A8C4TLT7_ERPCA